VWAGRLVLWAVIIVVLVNGVTAIFQRFTQGTTQGQGSVATPTDSGFPVTPAAAFAKQFAAIYLNFNGNDPDTRSRRLKPFLPEGAADQFGWNGFGRMQTGGIELKGVDVTDANNAVVTLAVQSDDRRWLFSVPVYADNGAFVVSRQPALLPAPGPAGLPQVPEPERDDATAAELRPQLEGFFKAFAAGDAEQLQRYVAAGVSLSGFGGGFTLAQLKDVVVPPGGTTRQVTAVVVWGISGDTPDPTATAGDAAAQPAALEQAYELTVEKQGDKWFVKDIHGASRSAG
jgi:hypothetical protein